MIPGPVPRARTAGGGRDAQRDMTRSSPPSKRPLRRGTLSPRAPSSGATDLRSAPLRVRQAAQPRSGQEAARDAYRERAKTHGEPAIIEMTDRGHSLTADGAWH